MKKFTKIALILAVVLFSVGLVSVIGSFAMGLTWDSLGDMVDRGKFSFNFKDDDEPLYVDMNQDYGDASQDNMLSQEKEDNGFAAVQAWWWSWRRREHHKRCRQHPTAYR